VVLVLALALIGVHHKSGGKSMQNNTVGASGMIISSPAFKDSQPIPEQYSCKGQNTSPPLSFSSPPASAKSLALIVHDPDAPSGDYAHWVMWNIAPSTTEIAANSVPTGAMQGPNTGGRNTYMGPCPPSGTHHYIFELYALDGVLDLPPQTSRDQLLAAINGHTLAKATLTGLFSH
jgi:hypothetical protein